MPVALLAPIIPLPVNALKSLVFRVSALLIQLTITNLFTLIAFRHNAFTSQLIFSEPLLQQLIYILQRRSFLVLSFLVLITAGGLWSTMLWGLDRPGFLLQPQHVGADTIANHRRRNPPYAVMSRSRSGDVGGLNIIADLTAGLYEGINATLTVDVAAGHPQIAQTPTWMPVDFNDGSFTGGSEFPGARIFLDEHGWSLGVDSLGQSSESNGCATTYDGITGNHWACEVDYTNNSRIGADYFRGSFAVPNVWWSNENGILDYESILPERGANPWDSLGTGGDTVMMKMVLSVARGLRKHTFMVSAMKTTLLAFNTAPIRMEDVQDLVQRSWRARESVEVQMQDLDAIRAAREKPMTGLSLGRQHSDGFKITSRNYLLQATIVEDTTVFTAFQILDVNVTLVNSETVQQEPTPFEDCDTWYENVAFGGVVEGSSCFLALRADGRTGVFQGQSDTMAVFILSGTLAKRRATTAADALNEHARRWIQENDGAIEVLLLSRAYIAAGDAGAVKVDVYVIRPAVSILQLFLLMLPVLTFILSWGSVRGWVGKHFQSSLFANLIATTHDGYHAEKPGFMTDPPQLTIVRDEGRVYLGTATGVFWHTGRQQVVAEAQMHCSNAV